MKPILALALCLGLLAVAGCRADGSRELLERDLRDHEDQIYDLQDQVDQLTRQLEASRHQVAALEKGAAPPSGDDAPRVTRPPTDVPALPKIDLGTPEATPPDASGPNAPLEGKPPADLPPPGDAPLRKQPTESPANSSAKSAEPASLTEPADAPPAAPPGEIQRIALSRLMTGGHSFSGKPGDDGLLVVFTPRDAAGEPTPAAGDVAIVVIDPKLKGPAAHVARWDFSAVEAAAHYHRGQLTKAFHFELLWPDHAPEHHELKLYVRLTTADGRRFVDSLNVRVHLPGDAPPAAWTKPEPPRRWAPATLPTGAQFDPDAEAESDISPLAPRSERKSAALRAPPVEAASSAGAPPPPIAGRRPVWSPYR